MKIALGVTGGIAAYKAAEVVRGLQQAGIAVQVILTRAASRFVGSVTFEALSGLPVMTSMFRAGENRDVRHVQLAREVGLLAVVPATADIIGKFAHGIADDFLSTFYLACPAPVLLAPAMNTEMWRHPAVQANVRVLEERGHRIVYPESGELACGATGPGRLADTDTILNAIHALLGAEGPWKGLKVLVTAGPTVEDLDPVRFLSNRSSGKMGYAVARAARRRGAEVFLVSGPTELAPPPGVELVRVRSAEQMRQAVLELYPRMDVVIKAAAVADYRPRHCSADKIKKGKGTLALELEPTIDILETLGRSKGGQILVGFAAETGDPSAAARAKLAAKNLDIIVANDVSRGVFGAERASAVIIGATGEEVRMEEAPKAQIAERLLDMVDGLRAARAAGRGGDGVLR